MSASVEMPEIHQRWTLDDIPWHLIRPEELRDKDELFFLIASASFMESTTHLYTRNLLDFFAEDEEITGWLQDHWLNEELQHGRALRKYVETAWPWFEWEKNYQAFVAEFDAYCGPDSLEQVRGLEMVSRCAVEMGTASYYTTLKRLAPEPALAKLAHCIYSDEVNHYKHFYRYYLRLKELEGIGRGSVTLALWRRLRMTNGDDSFIALKHVFNARHPDKTYDMRVYKELRRQARAVAFDHFPHDLSVKMLLKPLDLGPRAQSVAQAALEAVARRLVP